MGQVRTPECDKIDAALREVFPGDYSIECRQDTYTQDYIIWVTANEEIYPVRITRDEYEQDDWRGNVLILMQGRF